MTQLEDIAKWLKSGKTLTSMQALSMFGCARLASRINDLRRDGWQIRTEMLPIKTRRNRGTKIARYSLASKARRLVG